VVPVEPEPIVVQEVAAPPDPQPVVFPPEPAEPVVTPEEAPVVVVEPEPIVVPEVAATTAPEPAAEPIPAPEPPPEGEIRLAPALEPAEAEPVIEATAEPRPVDSPSSTAEVEAEPAAEAPVAEEPEPRPALRIARPPEPLEERSGRDVASRDDEPTGAAREPEPDLGALPDYVVAPSSSSGRKAAPPPRPPEPEPEPDLGPLPDYIVDPSRPVEPSSETTRQAAHSALQPSGIGRDHDPEPSAGTTAVMYFPPVTSFPLPRDGEDDDDDVVRGEARKPKRRRPPADAGKAKRKRSLEEPGDETSEASWMAGLSNRLSAYSLAEEGEASEDEDAPDGGASVEPRT
jgi:hypothetical protein